MCPGHHLPGEWEVVREREGQRGVVPPSLHMPGMGEGLVRVVEFPPSPSPGGRLVVRGWEGLVVREKLPPHLHLHLSVKTECR